MKKIQIFTTGGTLDKEYDPATGELFFPESNVPTLLQQGLVTLPIQVQSLLKKDSLEMNEGDREKIAAACARSPHDHIVITHGTDTMVETGRKILELTPTIAFEALQRKSIVLTGAMRPFALGNSDAAFNLGASLIAVQSVQPGVYICMNGRLHRADKVFKNIAMGVFEAFS